jgi:hypothetical protein
MFFNVGEKVCNYIHGQRGYFFRQVVNIAFGFEILIGGSLPE